MFLIYSYSCLTKIGLIFLVAFDWSKKKSWSCCNSDVLSLWYDRYDDVSVYRTTTFALGAHVRLLDLPKDKLPCPATQTTKPGFDSPSRGVTSSHGSPSSSSADTRMSSPAPVAVSQPASSSNRSKQRDAGNAAASTKAAHIWILVITFIAHLSNLWMTSSDNMPSLR